MDRQAHISAAQQHLGAALKRPLPTAAPDEHQRTNLLLAAIAHALLAHLDDDSEAEVRLIS
ncbi:hypothetical protein AB0M95_36950 [Sphaerisporangium sp. NPDC051017]|uniref:hypothetical protein n=1 Tax=Sphaerisporangium sp. NPDC051017 TaxID=3154636 RepID=UPI00342FAD0D